MNRGAVILTYLAAFILKPAADAVLPGHIGNGNLVLCLTIVLVFLYDEYVPIITTGTLFALLNDLVYGLYCGPEAVATFAVCVAIIAAKYFFNNENYVNASVVLIVSTWLEYTVEWAVYYAAGSTYTYGYALRGLPGSAAVNTAVGMIVYFVLYNRIKKKRYERLYR